MTIGLRRGRTPGISGSTSTLVTFGDEYEPHGVIYLVLPAHSDSDRLSFNTRWLDYATTAYLVRCLWGPGSLVEAIEALEQHLANKDWQPDTIQPESGFLG
ncbi:MAG: hypothetical protein C7B47_14385 [Sulfobacillus thermosulfidooxidans]|uniref:Uncharacterized protein n=1 Tax=Sulfobacillus thermosulfidooxidans TaxID=28034 RepID=A0A2T2WQV5_SULTH|nr:MAG: hypothetical protein C7B47_14385 [Sulfobacillus thermosulfidooxidans]